MLPSRRDSHRINQVRTLQLLEAAPVRQAGIMKAETRVKHALRKGWSTWQKMQLLLLQLQEPIHGWQQEEEDEGILIRLFFLLLVAPREIPHAQLVADVVVVYCSTLNDVVLGLVFRDDTRQQPQLILIHKLDTTTLQRICRSSMN